MVRCSRCGVPAGSGATFCDQCGADLPQSAGPASPPSPSPSPPRMGGGKVVHIGREMSTTPGEESLVIPATAGQVSRSQARVYVGADGQLAIENMSRANGTSVNGVLVVGRMPFRLTDTLRFGSYIFHTNRLSAYLGAGSGPPSPAPYPMHAQAPAPAYGGAPSPVSPGAPRVYGNLTVFDRVLADESPWMRGFMVTYGILLILLFFLPILVVKKEVVTAMSVLGQAGVDGYVKLALGFMPVVGVTLLVLRAVGAGRIIVGVALLAASVFGLGIVAGLDEGPRRMAMSGSWHFVFRWLFMAGTSFGLLAVCARPRDVVARTMLGIFAPMLALSYLFPVKVRGESTVELVATIKAMEGAPGWAVLFLLLQLVPLVVALSALFYLSAATAERAKGPGQWLALFLCLFPGITLFLAFLFLAVDVDKPGIVLTGIWTGLYAGYLYLFPALGGTLLFLGLRRS